MKIVGFFLISFYLLISLRRNRSITISLVNSLYGSKFFFFFSFSPYPHPSDINHSLYVKNFSSQCHIYLLNLR